MIRTTECETFRRTLASLTRRESAKSHRRNPSHVPEWAALAALLLVSCGPDALAQNTHQSAPSAAQSAELNYARNCSSVYVDPALFSAPETHKDTFQMHPADDPDVFCARVNDTGQPAMPEILAFVRVRRAQGVVTHVAISWGAPPPADASFQPVVGGSFTYADLYLPEAGLTASLAVTPLGDRLSGRGTVGP